MLKDKYLTTKEAGKLIGRTPNMMLKLCQDGRFSGAEKIGGCWLIPREAVVCYKPNKRGRKSSELLKVGA